MNEKEALDFIKSELEKKIRVFVEMNDYPSLDASELTADYLDDYGHEYYLVKKRVMALAEDKSAINCDGIQKEIMNLDKLLSDFSTFLLANAKQSKVNPIHAGDEIFEKLARIFEKKHEPRLCLHTPSLWI